MLRREQITLWKTRKEVYRCPHTNRKHYAKNMCLNCYHKSGRTKLAWACEHKSKLHYSKGMCQSCYLTQYHKGKKKHCKPVRATPDAKILASFEEEE